MRSPLPNKVVDFFICIYQQDMLSLYCENIRTDEDGVKIICIFQTLFLPSQYNKTKTL
jgi:hypothetical protein